MQIVSASPTLLLNAILATWAQFCKDCYIISTCTPSCPATGTAWLWWLAWAGAWLCYPLMWLSIYNKEPISSTSTSELFKKALVDIWIDLYLIKFQFLAILCVFVFLSLEEFFFTGVQSCPYWFNSKPLGLGRISFLTGSSCLDLGLCTACSAYFMCHPELWPTSLSHPFSSLNCSLGFAGGKHYQKITIFIFRVVFQNFAISGCFPYVIFYRYLSA